MRSAGRSCGRGRTANSPARSPSLTSRTSASKSRSSRTDGATRCSGTPCSRSTELPAADKIGKPIFPPKDRKTKRSPMRRARFCFSDAPITTSRRSSDTSGADGRSISSEGVAGGYCGDDGQVCRRAEGVSGCPFLRREDGPAVHAERRGDSTEGTEAAQTADGEEEKARNGDRTTAERAPSTARVPEVVPATQDSGYRMRSCEEDRRGACTRAGRSAGDHHQERALRQETEQKLLRATSMPKPPAKDDRSLRLEAAAKRSRRTDDRTQAVTFAATGPSDRVGEGQGGLTNERDKLKEERDALKLANATLASQIIRSTIGLRKQNSSELS